MSNATPRSMTSHAHSFACKGSHHHENIIYNCRRCCGGTFAGSAGLRTNRRPKARQDAFRNVMQAGSAKAVRPRHAVSAFVLVSRVAAGIRGCAEGRSRVRHRLLGHRAEPAVESPRADAGEESRRGRRSDRQGTERRRQDAARARLHRRARGHLRRLR